MAMDTDQMRMHRDLIGESQRIENCECTATDGLKTFRKEFLLKMSTDDPEVTTVTSKGQITIPSRLRKEFGLEKGTKLMVVPTDYGLVLKKIELPSVEEFQRRVEQRAEAIELSLKDVDQLVHEALDN